MLRIFLFVLIIIVAITLMVGVDPSCTLVLGAAGDPCQAGQTETLSQHLAHGNTTFPDVFIFSLSALLTLAALVSGLLTRSAFLSTRDLRRSPEDPPRFA